MDELELGEFARSKGLFVEEILQWREACKKANGSLAQETVRLNNVIKQLQTKVSVLEKDLTIKEKALAEIAALQVLEKKALSIWGETVVD